MSLTADEVRAFQDAHDDWEGKRLLVDGIVGPRTEWALGIAHLPLVRQDIVSRACAYVGMREVPPSGNRGIEIDAWLERCGAPIGSPWCAAFASWCLSVPGQRKWAQASAQALGKSMRATDRPLPGDLMWFPTGPWQGHCGIVIGVGAEDVATVEGNQRNAARAVRRLRSGVRFGDALTENELMHAVPVPPGLDLIPVTYEGTR